MGIVLNRESQYIIYIGEFGFGELALNIYDVRQSRCPSLRLARPVHDSNRENHPKKTQKQGKFTKNRQFFHISYSLPIFIQDTMPGQDDSSDDTQVPPSRNRDPFVMMIKQRRKNLAEQTKLYKKYKRKYKALSIKMSRLDQSVSLHGRQELINRRKRFRERVSMYKFYILQIKEQLKTGDFKPYVAWIDHKNNR